MKPTFFLLMAILIPKAYAASPNLLLIDDCGPPIERVCSEGSRTIPIHPRGLRDCTEKEMGGSPCSLPKGIAVCVAQPGFRCVGRKRGDYLGRAPTYRRCTVPRDYACPR